MRTFWVIPAEGDSPETEQWYIRRLAKWYEKNDGERPRILVFDATVAKCDKSWRGLSQEYYFLLQKFAMEHCMDLRQAEIHAQGGMGAALAVMSLSWVTPQRVFFIGGAPAEAMTGIAKFFHRYFVRLWYYLPIPFFADDPPNDADSAEIRAWSTQCMKSNPLLYRNQLLMIGHFGLRPGCQLGCPAFFVPNGDTARGKKYWDNTYDNDLAKAVWQQHGVSATEKPEGGFSFYNLMPAEELFSVMDKVRD